MDFQSGFNLVMTIFCILIGLVGFLGKQILSDVKEDNKVLKDSHYDLSDKVQKVEVSMARDYATNIRLEQIGRDIFALLHRIEDKLDGKADK